VPPLLFHLSGAATSSSVEPTCTSRSRGDYNVLWVLTSPSGELHLPRKLRCHFSNFTKFMAQKNVNPCIQLKTIGKDFTCSFTFTGHLPRKPQLAQQEAQLSQRGRATVSVCSLLQQVQTSSTHSLLLFVRFQFYRCVGVQFVLSCCLRRDRRLMKTTSTLTLAVINILRRQQLDVSCRNEKKRQVNGAQNNSQSDSVSCVSECDCDCDCEW